MIRPNLIIAIAVALITISIMALFNIPESEPRWPERIQGFSFSPMRANQDGMRREYPSEKEISEDLALLSSKTYAIRTYTMDGTLAEIPRLAQKYGINVTAGAWIAKDTQRNIEQVNKLIEVAKNNDNVVRAIIGNESLLRNDINKKQLFQYLDSARVLLDIPVSTAEPWHIWLQNPDMAQHVDFIAVQMLPYWEGQDVNAAVGHIVNRMQAVHEAFPDKPIIISEVGWPSNGRTYKAAVPSEANEGTFLRRFLDTAAKENYTYYVMEAFDQPWKRYTSEGSIGAYWGVYDVDRHPKFAFDSPIVNTPDWPVLAVFSIVIAIITFALLLSDSDSLRARGRSFLAVIAFSAATATVWIVYEYSKQYLTFGGIVVGILMILGMFGVTLVLLAEAHEWAEAHWVSGRRREFRPIHMPDDELPMVSIHIPAYNEPPEMMIETLNALAELDYPCLEVIVIDNNTKDPAVWEPVQAHCTKLGERFRFFHIDPLPGFKAGALNYALRNTSPLADIVAVIDSDYVVDKNWLRDLTPQFSDARIAIVQAPQDYRDAQQNAFKAMSYAEYRGFFYIGMITRNDRNAIIQHGTMTMIRRAVLDEVGGWSEWCITEDAELGLRIFEHGYEATYVSHSFGKGLMPDTFNDFKKQRFRWAFGAMQILRHHAGILMGTRESRLTLGQRYHFFAGWLPWLADGMNLIYNLAALFWSVAMIVAPSSFDPPLVIFSILPLTLFTFKIAKLIYLYQTRVGARIKQTIAAAIAGLALTHTISRAILSGLTRKELAFYRTPKMAKDHALLQAFSAAREEALMFAALCLAAYSVMYAQESRALDLLLWVIVLLIQSIPYLAAIVVSAISALPGLSSHYLGNFPADHRQSASAHDTLKETGARHGN
jgi:exo-beta-1,3-glucanase (GH17 family)/cellulose synthase/poly-beta-1,6-N-acetylglucosamine synthase-like glycosyltransferase